MFDRHPLPPGMPKTLKAEGHIFKMLSRLQINPGSAGYLSKSMYLKMGIQMFVWRANGNPNRCNDLDEILHAHPYLSKEGFGASLTSAPLPPLSLGS